MKPRSNSLFAVRAFPTHFVLSFGVVVAGLGVQSAMAINETWSATPSSANFSGPNWTPNANVATTDSLTFATSTITSLNNDNLGFNYAGLTFDSGASQFNLGGNSFTLSGGITNNSTSLQAIANPIALAATQTVNTNTGNVNLSSFISGGFGLTKTGSGTLTLTGGSSYTGLNTLSAGTVSIIGSTGLGAAAAPIRLDGGTLLVNTPGTTDNAHITTVDAAGGTIRVNTPNNTTFRLTVATSLLGTGALTLTGNGSLGVSGANTGVMVLQNANVASTFGGTLTMQDGGLLEINNNTGLNSAVAVTLGNNGGVSVNGNVTAMASPVIVNGTNSVLNFANSGNGVVTGTVTLNNDLTIRMANWYGWGTAQNGAINGVISGNGGFTAQAPGNPTLTLGAANTYLGATTLFNAGLTLTANATSSIAGSSGITLCNSALTASYAAGIPAGAGKFNDAGKLSMRNNSSLVLTGNATDTTETIGMLEIAGGNNTINITTSGTAVTTLAASSLNRTNLGVGLLIGSSLGNQATSVSKISLTTPPSGANFVGGAGYATGTGIIKNLGIVPWLVANPTAAGTAGRELVTYDTTLGSLRGLVSDEYDAAGTIAGAAPGNNVKTATVSETALASATLNALLLAPTEAQTITGDPGSTLTISSGTLTSAMASGAAGTNPAFNSTISGFDAVAFGNGEAVIRTEQTLGNITINSPISVTAGGGLTKAGAGTGTLGAANTYTGTTKITQLALATTVNNAFNGTTGTPMVLSNNAQLNVNATTQKITTLTFNGAGNGGGAVIGAGGTLDLGGDVTFETALTNPNAAVGISVSNLNLNANRVFNVGDALSVTGAEMSVSSIIADGSAGSSLTKTGAGMLALSGASTYTGATNINGGTLVVTTLSNGGLASNIGASGAAAANLVINGGSLRHTGTVTSTDRNFTFGDNGVTLDASGAGNAALSLTGNATYVTPDQPRTLTLAGGSTGANSYGGNLVDNGTGALAVTKTGAGTWALTGTNTYSGGTNLIQGTLQIGNGGTTGSLTGDVATGVNCTLAFNRSDSHSYSGVISGFGGLTKSGTGALSLSGKSTMIGNINFAGGTTNLSGTVGGNTTNGNFRVGTVTGTPATLNILPGSNGITRFNLFIGDNGDAVNIGTSGGAIYQSGGSLILTQGGGIDNLRVGSNARAYGYYGISGGSVISNEIGIGASLADTIGVVEVSSGGTVTSTNWLTLARGSATSSGLLNVTGGTVNAARLELNNGSPLTAGALSVVNVAGGNVNLTGTGSGLNLASGSNTAGIIGVVNLLAGGTVTTTIVTGSQANHTAALNFSGGTLKAQTTNSGATFLTSANIDNVNVFAAGGTIDNNGTAITIGRPMVVPAGFGVSGTSIAVPSGGSGYIGAPLVKFTGGTGTGATGYAVVSGGVVTGITVTSPGTGYLLGETLTATFFGAAATPATAVTDIPVAANVTTGGMTFQGSGTTSLTGVNTYLGTTTVAGGVLAVNGTALADSGKLVIASGKVQPTGTEVVDTLFFGAVQQAFGTYGSTASAATFQDDTQFSGTGVISVTTGAGGSAYAAWALTKGLDGTNNGATQDNGDFDGVANVLEFVLGGNPKASDPLILPDPTEDATNFYFTFNRADESEAEVGLTFQYGSDLTGWTDVAVGATTGTSGSGVVVTEDLPSPAVDTVVVTVPKTSAVDAKLFGRLKAVK